MRSRDTVPAIRVGDGPGNGRTDGKLHYVLLPRMRFTRARAENTAQCARKQEKIANGERISREVSKEKSAQRPRATSRKFLLFN